MFGGTVHLQIKDSHVLRSEGSSGNDEYAMNRHQIPFATLSNDLINRESLLMLVTQSKAPRVQSGDYSDADISFLCR